MDLLARIDDAAVRFEAVESSIHAFLQEDGRFDRLRRDARVLHERYQQAEVRPPLFGLLAGVKDLFHVDGMSTRAGSRLPPEVLRGSEAESVSRVKAAGALVLGKTVTTEFAHFSPGPTRNPHNLAHTPGGSSSGSAAAVAARLCDLALGSQTIGSIVRPASFCGVVGLKPTYGRISTDGVVPLAPSLDHVGCFAMDVATTIRAARVLYSTWVDAVRAPNPVLGVPAGPYLERLPADTATWFDDVCLTLSEAGYELRRVGAFADFPAVCARHARILAAEAARVHARWFAEYEPLYGTKIAALIREGQSVSDAQLERAVREMRDFRRTMEAQMGESGVDAWIAPSALGTAPRGLESTGDPVMNLPWTHAGFPVVSLPAGGHGSGLPMGLQIVGNRHTDESLLAVAEGVERSLAGSPHAPLDWRRH